MQNQQNMWCSFKCDECRDCSLLSVSHAMHYTAARHSLFNFTLPEIYLVAFTERKIYKKPQKVTKIIKSADYEYYIPHIAFLS